MTPSLQESALQTLQSFAQNNQDEHTPLDIYRTFEKQAQLLYQTQRTRETIESDPFQHLQSIPSTFAQRVQVKDYNFVQNRYGYVFTEAIVTVGDAITLKFLFEREPQNEEQQTMLSYCIDLSHHNGPRQKLLWCQVMAQGSSPSHLPAINLNDDEDDDGWSDVEEDDNDQDIVHERKRSKIETGNENQANIRALQEELNGDRFVAGMDADILGVFRRFTRLDKTVDDVAIFFLLMTFPFYDHEWDLVGYMLDAIFGYDVDTEEENDKA